jgi:hypothetical protein
MPLLRPEQEIVSTDEPKVREPPFFLITPSDLAPCRLPTKRLKSSFRSLTHSTSTNFSQKQWRIFWIKAATRLMCTPLPSRVAVLQSRHDVATTSMFFFYCLVCAHLLTCQLGSLRPILIFTNDFARTGTQKWLQAKHHTTFVGPSCRNAVNRKKASRGGR